MSTRFRGLKLQNWMPYDAVPPFCSAFNKLRRVDEPEALAPTGKQEDALKQFPVILYSDGDIYSLGS